MLPTDLALTALPLSDAAPQADAMDLPAATRQLEIQLIQQALQQADGNKSRAARLLNISERSLWYKLQAYQLK
jgi:two-component system, NtrC family, response regulator AtoC